MLELPVLADLAMDESPFAPKWKGPEEHTGDLEAATPLFHRMAGKTTCATVTMMAGVLCWGAKRAKPFYDSSYCFEMAEAAFAWQFDWRYFDGDREPYREAPDEPAAESAVLSLEHQLREVLDDDSVFQSFDPPVFSLVAIANTVNFILPKSAKRIYESWLKEVAGTLNEYALIPEPPRPVFDDFDSREAYQAYCEPRRGSPLPPLVLDMSLDLAEYDLDAEARKFLHALDHRSNRFLRSPESMVELGFVGIPYSADMK